MKVRKLIPTLTGSALALSLATAASAAITELDFTTTPGTQPAIYFNGYYPGTTNVDPNLHGLFTVTLDSVSSDHYTWNFSYTLQNTSTEASRLSVVGWDLPGATLKTATGVTGLFTDWSSGQLASLGKKDFCLTAQTCSGGGGGGLTMGQDGSGQFSLVFLSSETIGHGKSAQIITVPAPSTLSFTDFGVHYQALADGQSTVGVPSGRPLPPPPGVPEPASWMLMLLSLTGLGAALRRRRAALSAA